MGKYGKKYLLFFLCIVMLLCAGCSEKTTEELPGDPVSAQAGYRRTLLYYQSDEGFLVPVMKLLPWEEGIGKAALSHLVGTEENSFHAAAKGLNPLLPEGVEFSLRIADDKTATLDIKGLSEYPDAKSEAAMVNGITLTLCEFESIERVQFLFDGKKLKKLPHGTNVENPKSVDSLNPDPGEAAASAGAMGTFVTLYFPNASGSLLVPVSRYIEGTGGFESAMRELAAGPLQNGLIVCLPEGTELLSCSMENGVVTMDFSKELLQAENTVGLTEAMCDAIAMTAACYGTVDQLHLFAEGELFTVAELPSPLYANAWNE